MEGGNKVGGRTLKLIGKMLVMTEISDNLLRTTRVLHTSNNLHI